MSILPMLRDLRAPCHEVSLLVDEASLSMLLDACTTSLPDCAFPGTSSCRQLLDVNPETRSGDSPDPVSYTATTGRVVYYCQVNAPLACLTTYLGESGQHRAPDRPQTEPIIGHYFSLHRHPAWRKRHGRKSAEGRFRCER